MRRRLSRDGLRCIPVLLLLCLVACGSPTRFLYAPYKTHTVRSGETLFTIAFRYGKDHRDLARWNNLGDGTLIFPGQVIRLVPPSGTSTARSTRPASSQVRTLPPPPNDPSPAWNWPATGRVVTEFDGAPGSGTGLGITGRSGQQIRAAAGGRVVYAGGGLIGYGKLLIIKHNDTYLSAYGYNATLLVKEGDVIKRGQPIATMGVGPGKEPRLHFEIRRNGKPVSPRKYLPAP